MLAALTLATNNTIGSGEGSGRGEEALSLVVTDSNADGTTLHWNEEDAPLTIREAGGTREAVPGNSLHLTAHPGEIVACQILAQGGTKSSNRIPASRP